MVCGTLPPPLLPAGAQVQASAALDANALRREREERRVRVRGEAALGLGLPLTRQFIEAHGGTVELQSKKGKGTTVTLIIPRGSK